ncbi:MAG: PIN domain-containing protein [Thiobacillaceae bacterium]
MINKAIVLDANILIRAVLGRRVRELIFTNASSVKFFAPDVAYADARKYLPALLEKRGGKSVAANKAPRSKLRGINTALQAAGYRQPSHQCAGN